MIRYIKQQLALRRFKKDLQTQNRIDPEFLKSARNSFVAMAGLRAQVTSVRPARWSSASRYATIAIVAVLALTSGLAVFAQVNDVSPNSPLYPLKRLGEQVQLAITPPAKQAELHQIFAARRLKEITILKSEAAPEALLKAAAPLVAPELNRKPEKNIIVTASISAGPASSSDERLEKLNDDFRQEAEKAIEQSDQGDNQKGKQAQVCDDILNALNHASASVPAATIAGIKTRCSLQF